MILGDLASTGGTPHPRRLTLKSFKALAYNLAFCIHLKRSGAMPSHHNVHRFAETTCISHGARTLDNTAAGPAINFVDAGKTDMSMRHFKDLSGHADPISHTPVATQTSHTPVATRTIPSPSYYTAAPIKAVDVTHATLRSREEEQKH